jgi:hypothetical protein
MFLPVTPVTPVTDGVSTSGKMLLLVAELTSNRPVTPVTANPHFDRCCYWLLLVLLVAVTAILGPSTSGKNGLCYWCYWCYW